MLNYTILASKRTFTKELPDGTVDEYKDLLSRSMIKDTFDNKNVWVVNEYYVARPDLVSLAFYGTDEYADILCKINGISNPFELNENDLLVIPSIDEITNIVLTAKPNATISDSMQIGNDKKTFQKYKDERRTPNEQVIGHSNYTIDRGQGLIYY